MINLECEMGSGIAIVVFLLAPLIPNKLIDMYKNKFHFTVEIVWRQNGRLTQGGDMTKS